MPASRAKWLSVPKGRIPRGRSRPASAAAAALTVPSPPPTTTASSSRVDAASAKASGRSAGAVSRTSAWMPWASSAVSIWRFSVAPGTAFAVPPPGLTITRTRIGFSQRPKRGGWGRPGSTRTSAVPSLRDRDGSAKAHPLPYCPNGNSDSHRPRRAGHGADLRSPSPPTSGKGRRRQEVRAGLRIFAGGRPADRDRRDRRGDARGREGPGAARRDRIGQDLHDGQGDRGIAAPRAGARAQQDPRRAALRRVQELLPRTTRSNISSAITIITSPRPMCRARTPTSRRKAR